MTNSTLKIGANEYFIVEIEFNSNVKTNAQHYVWNKKIISCNNKGLAELEELIYKTYYNIIYDFEGSNIKCKDLWGTIRTLYRQKICFHSLGHYGVIIPLSFVLKRTVKK